MPLNDNTDEDWVEVATDVRESEITIDNLSPCTKYSFAVAAVLDGDEETEKSISAEIETPLDEGAPFEPPNLGRCFTESGQDFVSKKLVDYYPPARGIMGLMPPKGARSSPRAGPGTRGQHQAHEPEGWGVIMT